MRGDPQGCGEGVGAERGRAKVVVIVVCVVLGGGGAARTERPRAVSTAPAGAAPCRCPLVCDGTNHPPHGRRRAFCRAAVSSSSSTLCPLFSFLLHARSGLGTMTSVPGILADVSRPERRGQSNRRGRAREEIGCAFVRNPPGHPRAVGPERPLPVRVLPPRDHDSCACSVR